MYALLPEAEPAQMSQICAISASIQQGMCYRFPGLVGKHSALCEGGFNVTLQFQANLFLFTYNHFLIFDPK